MARPGGCRHLLLPKSRGFTAVGIILAGLAPLHGISRGTEVEKQHLQPEATIPSFSGLLGASWLWRREDSVHSCGTNPAALR